MAKLSSENIQLTPKKQACVTLTMRGMVDLNQFSYYEDTEEGPRTGDRFVPSTAEEILAALQQFVNDSLERDPCGIVFQMLDDDGKGKYEWEVDVDEPK